VTSTVVLNGSASLSFFATSPQIIKRYARNDVRQRHAIDLFHTKLVAEFFLLKV
jgi:hypothetical protein